VIERPEIDKAVGRFVGDRPTPEQIRRFLGILTDLVACALINDELPPPDQDFIAVRRWLSEQAGLE
jgi:hypothetical protein